MFIPKIDEKRRTSAWPCLFCQALPQTRRLPPRQDGGDLHTPAQRMKMKRKSTSKTSLAATEMTAADAGVATLVPHGLDTIYALPGLQNDPLFDALFRFSDRLCTLPHPHQQGAA